MRSFQDLSVFAITIPAFVSFLVGINTVTAKSFFCSALSTTNTRHTSFLSFGRLSNLAARHPSFSLLYNSHDWKQQQQEDRSYKSDISSSCSSRLFLTKFRYDSSPNNAMQFQQKQRSRLRTERHLFFNNNKNNNKENQQSRNGAGSTVTRQIVVYDGAEWTSIRKYFLLLRQQQQEQDIQQQKQLKNEGLDVFDPSIVSQFGIAKIATGTINQRRVVGMMIPTIFASSLAVNPNSSLAKDAVLLDNSPIKKVYLYKDSIATIPASISDADARSTYIHAIAPVHCALPCASIPIPSEGGSENGSTSSSSSSFPMEPTETPCNIVVLGGNDYASKTVLAILAANPNAVVYVVSQQRNKMLPINSRIRHLNPSSTNFAQSINLFDAVVDCLGNEHDPNDVVDTENRNGPNGIGTGIGGSIVQLLKDRHGCTQYISTETKSQALVVKNGLLAGPNEQKQYVSKQLAGKVDKLLKKTSGGSSTFFFPAPPKIGVTIERLLNASALYTPPIVPLTVTPIPSTSADYYVRGWSLKDFWEYTTWPRDASTTNTRYGFPLSDELLRSQLDDEDNFDDDDEDNGEMVSAPPFRGNRFQTQPEVESYEEEEDDDDDDNLISGGGSGGGGVQKFTGVAGLQASVIKPQKTGVLFLSAPFCRTCRYLKPKYIKMSKTQQQQFHRSINTTTTSLKTAAISSETEKLNETTTSNLTESIPNDPNEFIFWNSETIGVAGKELGRALNVNAVPTFLLFKDGKVYGKPLSISKLPSPKLSAAIQLLQSNEKWDDSILRQAEEETAESSSSSSSPAATTKKKKTN